MFFLSKTWVYDENGVIKKEWRGVKCATYITKIKNVSLGGPFAAGVSCGCSSAGSFRPPAVGRAVH